MASKTSLEQRTLSVPLEDGQTLSIQILELPKQTFVWLGHDVPRFNSLVVATPTRFDTLPATSALLGPGDGSSLAQRLAMKTGKLVLVSSNLPVDSSLLQSVAEKHLLSLLAAPKTEAV